jgi:hypothetical protein
VYLPGQPELFLQEELLFNGLAYIYPEFINGCWNGKSMWVAEQGGRAEQFGVWGTPGSIPPW